MFVLDWRPVRDTYHKGKLENVKMFQPTLSITAITKMKHFFNHTKIAPYFDVNLAPINSFSPELRSRPLDDTVESIYII